MENNNLEMGLFGGETELELNLGGTPVNDGEPTPGEPNPEDTQNNTPPEEVPPVDENIQPNEDIVPESVVGEDQTEGEDVTSPNLFSSFASTLQEQGVLPSFDQDKTEITDTDGLANVIKGEIDSQVKQYLINKVGQEGFDALEKGVSLTQYEQHVNNATNLEGLTEDVLKEDLDLAKRVIMQDYINQGLSEDRARRILQKTVDLGDEAIIDDSLESVNSLKAFEHNRIEQEKVANVAREKEVIKQQEKIDNDLKNIIYQQEEFIAGMPNNKAIQDQVYKSITEVVGESPEGVMENKLMQDRRSNPIEFDAKLYYLYELTEGFKNFSKISKTAETKAATDFERVLRQTKFEGSGNPTYMDDTNSYDGLGAELVLE